MSTREQLIEKWNRITCHSGGGFMLDVEHNLDWYVALVEERKTLIFVSNRRLNLGDPTDSVELRCIERGDGRYNNCFILLDSLLEEVFIEMAIDLIETSRHESSAELAIDSVMSRFEKWRMLMRVKKGKVLDGEKLQGLMGEVVFLKSLLDSGRSPDSVLDGWKGPEYGVRDFVYPQVWYEVKTVGFKAIDVTISSIEQLDVSTLGELVVVQLIKSQEDEPGSMTLNDMVNACSESLDGHEQLQRAFKLKLAEFGYAESEAYNDAYFRHIDTMRYRVDNSFPRICRNMIPEAVYKMTYKLLLDQLIPWKCSEEL